MAALARRYEKAERITWVQEEPANMGPWTFVWPRVQTLLTDGRRLRYAGRAEAASPATGSPRIHRAERDQLLEDALGGL